MVAIHTTDWQPMVILGGISKKEETDLNLYSSSNFLDKFKPGLELVDEPLFTTYSKNLVSQKIAPIHVLGPGDLYEPLVPEEAKGAVDLEPEEEHIPLWKRLAKIDEISKAYPGRQLYVGSNDIAPTRTDLATLREYTASVSDAAIAIPAVEARPLVELGFRKDLSDKVYMLQNQDGISIDYFAFPEIYCMRPEAVPLSGLISDITRDVHRFRGEGIKNIRVLWEIAKNAGYFLWSERNENPIPMLWKLCWTIMLMNTTRDLNNPVDTGASPATRGDVASLLSNLLVMGDEESIDIGSVDAPGLSMDADTLSDLEAMRRYHLRERGSTYRTLHDQGALEPW